MRKPAIGLSFVALSLFAVAVMLTSATCEDATGPKVSGSPVSGKDATRPDVKERPLESRIASVGLFKNGLAVVKRTVELPGPGTFRIDDVPQPVHGTFWIESDAKIVTRLTRRSVEVPAGVRSKGDFQQELVGKEVVIHFADSDTPPATGRVVKIETPKGEEAWNRVYQQSQNSRYSSRPNGPSGGGSLLILETKTGRGYIDIGQIAYVQAKGATGSVQRELPVLLLAADGIKEKPAKVVISYLAKGMAWAPSYRVDLSDPDVLSLHQKAVIKNELEPLRGAEVRLISGFPSVQFEHVTSPLSLQTTWASFFEQLNQRPRRGHASLSNAITQQAVAFNSVAPGGGFDLSAIPTGEGVDLHYQDVGKLTLEEGDSIALPVAAADADYESLVEWIVPDTRTADGRYVSDSHRNNEPDKYQDAAWDAVRFKNPLAFPMTTGPAMIVSKGKFNGQRTSYWVNPGESTTLHVTKALSIRTRNVEYEAKGNREEVYVGGHRYYKATVGGELRANNHRKQTIELVIRRRFSGELLEADGKPKNNLLEEGVYSVNRRNELNWSMPLKPGEEINLKYRYTVLVRY